MEARNATSAPDVDAFLYAGLHSGSQSDYGRVADPQLDALLERQRQEIDPAKRDDIVRQPLKLIATDAYSFATDAAKTYEIWQPGLKGYAPQYGVDRVPLPASWIDSLA